MKRKRKSLEVFGLSFLDCICCGFGGVILLYVMTTMEDGETREGVVSPARAEVNRIEQRLEDGERMLAEIRNSLEDEKTKLAEVEAEAKQLDAQMKQDQAELSDKRNVSEAKLEHANKLQSDIDAVKQQISDLKNRQSENAGGNLTEKKGNERRHYVTGLRLDGERSVVLLDCSASTVADSPEAFQQFYASASERELRTAPKRVRMLDSLDWLVATSQSERLQIILYDNEARFADAGTAGEWIERKAGAAVQSALDGAWRSAPNGGANLEAAVALANTLEPKPDNLYVIADGLPSDFRGGRIYNNANYRNQAFHRAVRTAAASRQALHFILFPLTGDMYAAPRMWNAAEGTGGSFFTPAPDWPN
ncbi:MAG: hypothetical protein GVY36_14625 [Verrucomicrobia bacterium]|jgi:Skp family chaperone for outer membrane proteins|nr:hypothetical protein [Verrucomicrobiota bacterium]